MSTPSKEAIEAAARALVREQSQGCHEYHPKGSSLRDDLDRYADAHTAAALTAAAPFMEAQAKAEALREAAEAIEHQAPVARHWAAGYLRSRAATVEGKDS